jgi:hypothetical protein
MNISSYNNYTTIATTIATTISTTIATTIATTYQEQEYVRNPVILLIIVVFVIFMIVLSPFFCVWVFETDIINIRYCCHCNNDREPYYMCIFCRDRVYNNIFWNNLNCRCKNKEKNTSNVKIVNLKEVVVYQSNIKLEKDICVICQEEITSKTKIAVLNCDHKYHKNCITEWHKEHNTCPICNQ